MTVFVTLTDVEKSWAKQWATAIYDASTGKNLHDAKVDKSVDSLELDIIGFSGELAFAKMTNQFPVTNTDGPTHIDCVVNGKTVDVKTTRRELGQLLVRPAHMDDPAEAYVLLTGTIDTGYTYKGHMYAEDVFQPENLTDLGHGPTYAVPQHRLNGGLPQ